MNRNCQFGSLWSGPVRLWSFCGLVNRTSKHYFQFFGWFIGTIRQVPSDALWLGTFSFISFLICLWFITSFYLASCLPHGSFPFSYLLLQNLYNLVLFTVLNKKLSSPFAYCLIWEFSSWVQASCPSYKFCESSWTSSKYHTRLKTIVHHLLSSCSPCILFPTALSTFVFHSSIVFVPLTCFKPLWTFLNQFAYLHITLCVFILIPLLFWLVSVIFSTTLQPSSDLYYTTHCHFCGFCLGFQVEHHQHMPYRLVRMLCPCSPNSITWLFPSCHLLIIYSHHLSCHPSPSPIPIFNSCMSSHVLCPP